MRYNLLMQTRGKIAQIGDSKMKVLDIFLPLSPAQAIVVEKAQILANTFGENEQKTELRIASLLLKNKSVSAAKQARSFNQFVEKFMPALFVQAKKLAQSANIARSESPRNGKYFYYLSFADLPEYISDPWHGAINKADILREAILQSA